MTTPFGAKNLIFWGAGATVNAGQRTTKSQGEFIRSLALDDKIASRVEFALKPIPPSSRWHTALVDLLLILGDNDQSNISNPWEITQQAVDAMSRHWEPQAIHKELENRIQELRHIFHWPALKQVIRACPGFDNSQFQFTDLFNMLDMHQASGHGFRVANDHFLSPVEIVGARSMLRMILQTMMYVDYHVARESDRPGLRMLYDFAYIHTKYQQNQGLELYRSHTPINSRDFYFADTAFACLNYDPIGLWAQFASNLELNRLFSVPHVSHPNGPAVPLKIFHDMGHFMTLRTPEYIEDASGKPTKQPFWFPMNESAVQRLNDPEHNTGRIIRISKYIFPHGSLCWRECPSCGKLNAFMGNTRDFNSASLIPPPP